MARGVIFSCVTGTGPHKETLRAISSSGLRFHLPRVLVHNSLAVFDFRCWMLRRGLPGNDPLVAHYS